ncbi:MAG TPA: preprotein translocase subunit SecG [Verrucomicrobiae bacterium]|jgi:protein translocase SecG subunit
MSFIAGLLTVIVVLNALLLILLVLVQLPKKDAGAGLAFGGGTADALFGAGSGNALTKITKWGTGTFAVLIFVLGMLQNSIHHNDTSATDFMNGLGKQPVPAQTSTASQPAAAPAAPATTTTKNLSSMVPPAATTTSNATK